MTRFFGQEAADDDEIRFVHQRRQVELTRAGVSELDVVHEWIGGDELEIEDARHAQQLLPDASRADHAQGAPGQADAHVVHALGPPAPAGEAVLEE